MPLPLWIPIASILGAAAASSQSQRPIQGPPLKKTIMDFMKPELEILRRRIEQQLDLDPTMTFDQMLQAMAQQGLNVRDGLTTSAVNLLYVIERVRRWQTTWFLDDEALIAVKNTDVPWHAVQNRLPRLPAPAIHLRLPVEEDDIRKVALDMSGTGNVSPKILRRPTTLILSSILLVEEEPGVRWRYVGSNDAENTNNLIYTNGWFDISLAGARAQLEGEVRIDPDYTYKDTGEDVIWKMMINLMLALEHDHLEGQPVEPRTSRVKKQAARERKRADYTPYTIVRLSSSARSRAATGTQESSERSPVRRHLRSGHWRSSWVLDPGDRPIYARKPRLDRQGEPMGGDLYQVLNWIFPTWVGEGEKIPKHVRVRK